MIRTRSAVSSAGLAGMVCALTVNRQKRQKIDNSRRVSVCVKPKENIWNEYATGVQQGDSQLNYLLQRVYF